jgi:hypothetical protein
MNRTILIVICDFLLVSLLAFSTVDINKVADQTTARTRMGLENPSETNRIGGRQDLGDVMRLALDEERKKQDAMAAELSKTRTAASQQQALLNQRGEQLQAFQRQLRFREEQAERLQEQQTNLVQQMTAAQSNIANLNQRLQASTLETLLTKEQRAAEEAEVRKQLEKAAELRQQLSALEKSNQLVTAQRERLANQLQLTEGENRAAAAQLAQTQEDLNVQRQQNVKLAEGVKVLAGKSSELAQEIRDNRSLAPNTIFNQFATNRVTISFDGIRPGFFGGESTKDKQTRTILASDGTNIFALCHVQDTLFTLWEPGTPWEELTGTLARDAAVFPLRSLSFYLLDPRVVLMPVSQDWVRELGCKVYRISSDPFKFQDAVVVGAQEGYYGECQFQIDLTAPQYLKMDRNSLKGLFGKFNPSTGDLVFSKNGDLLGIMANNTYCIIIRNFDAAATVRFGADARSQRIAETLSSLYSTVTGLPFKLQ